MTSLDQVIQQVSNEFIFLERDFVFVRSCILFMDCLKTIASYSPKSWYMSSIMRTEGKKAWRVGTIMNCGPTALGRKRLSPECCYLNILYYAHVCPHLDKQSWLHYMLSSGQLEALHHLRKAAMAQLGTIIINGTNIILSGVRCGSGSARESSKSIWV